ncbi:FMN-linked oxidoreductase [Hymenopellis radicata]|nr:FMN-linked oxidoreductase [Hymenopellis radicata]
MASKLFAPVKVGQLQLSHRVVLAPLTRLRTNLATQAVHVPLVPEYYAQRGKIPGTLLITEGTCIAEKAGGFPAVPGIFSDIQIAAWKEVTTAVHAQGSYIFLQIAAIGRQAVAGAIPDIVGPSAIPKDKDSPTPRPLAVPEIEEYVKLFGIAADNAVNKAGFDGVEIHGANGFLVDEFLQDVSNNRTDEYGGSVEARAKFVLAVVDSVARAVGADRVGLKLSPWSKDAGMGMVDPRPTYSYLAQELKRRQPELAWIHVVEARIQNGEETATYIAAGGYTRESGIKTADEKGDLVAYGRWYLANPDLPRKLKEDIPFNKYDRSTFYLPGSLAVGGYTDYPVALA